MKPYLEDHYANFVEQRIMMNDPYPLPSKGLGLGFIGVAGEAGELLELYKKHYFHGKELDREKVIHEMGDVLFYLQVIANELGLDFDTIREANIEKLSKRGKEHYDGSKT